MDYVAFLNSSGAVVAPYGYGRYAANLHFAPYVETVTLPVVSVDSSMLYGNHPENLARITYTSGGAMPQRHRMQILRRRIDLMLTIPNRHGDRKRTTE